MKALILSLATNTIDCPSWSDRLISFTLETTSIKHPSQAAMLWSVCSDVAWESGCLSLQLGGTAFSRHTAALCVPLIFNSKIMKIRAQEWRLIKLTFCPASSGSFLHVPGLSSFLWVHASGEYGDHQQSLVPLSWFYSPLLLNFSEKLWKHCGRYSVSGFLMNKWMNEYKILELLSSIKEKVYL